MDIEDTLAHVSNVRRRVRARAHGGAWFPAAVIAALMLGSIALYRSPFAANPFATNPFEAGTLLAPYAPPWAGLPWPERDAVLSYGYWFLGIPAAFALIAWWYRRRARELGVTVPWARVPLVGLGALIALAVVAAIPTPPLVNSWDLTTSSTVDLWAGLRSPLVPLALSLVALGVTERSVTLAVAGGWIGLIAWWFTTAGMGRIPGWLDYVLNGFQGPGLGGTIGLFDRAGTVLIGLALPLVVYALVRGVRAAR